MPEIILHIGAGKCGSSALQTALTAAPVAQNAAGARLSYAVIRRGRLLAGPEVRAGALGYASSDNAEALTRLSDRRLARIGRHLRAIDADKVVLSCEGWFSASDAFTERLLPALGIAPQVFCYVRPQVDYLNAAWWQWGAWEDSKTFDQWLAGRIRLAHWARRLTAWKGSVPVTVRLLPQDIVADFFGSMGFERPATAQAPVNKGLPEAVLRLYQRNRSLRPASHAPQMDFVLSRSLGLPGNTPWVISQDRAAQVIARVRRDNLDLLDLLDPVSRAIMRADRRWWSAGAYQDKIVSDHGPVPPDIGELQILQAALERAARQAGPGWTMADRVRDRLFGPARPVPPEAAALEASCVRLAGKVFRRRRSRRSASG